jgi:hypothetical protein
MHEYKAQYVSCEIFIGKLNMHYISDPQTVVTSTPPVIL